MPCDSAESFNEMISRKEITRSGVSFQIAGMSDGTASTSRTVVVPVRSSISAPLSHEVLKSCSVHVALSETRDCTQLENRRGGRSFPAMEV